MSHMMKVSVSANTAMLFSEQNKNSYEKANSYAVLCWRVRSHALSKPSAIACFFIRIKVIFYKEEVALACVSMSEANRRSGFSRQSAFSAFTRANFNGVLNTGDEDNAIAGSVGIGVFSYRLDILRRVSIGTYKL
jgi:hypothetical protein